MRACIPRFLFSRDAHMHPSVITRIIPGKFLRGFSCTAFASIRGYKPAVPLFPPPTAEIRRKKELFRTNSPFFVPSVWLTVRIPRMIISFENFEKIPPLSSCVFSIIQTILYNSFLEFLEFLFLQFYVSSPSNSRSSLSISEFFIFSFVARIEILDRIIDNEFLEIARSLFSESFISLLRNSPRPWK